MVTSKDQSRNVGIEIHEVRAPEMAISRNPILKKYHPCSTYFYKELEPAGFILASHFWTHFFPHIHITFIMKLLWILKSTFELNCLTKAPLVLKILVKQIKKNKRISSFSLKKYNLKERRKRLIISNSRI